MLNQELVQYVEGEIIPRYASFDGAHREDHVRKVIEEAMNMSAHYDVDESVQGSETSEDFPAYSIIMWTLVIFSGLIMCDRSRRFEESITTMMSYSEASASETLCARCLWNGTP